MHDPVQRWEIGLEAFLKGTTDTTGPVQLRPSWLPFVSVLMRWKRTLARRSQKGEGHREACKIPGQQVPTEPQEYYTLSQFAIRCQLPEVGARCGKSARRDLCGGQRVTSVPTAICRCAPGDDTHIRAIAQPLGGGQFTHECELLRPVSAGGSSPGSAVLVCHPHAASFCHPPERSDDGDLAHAGDPALRPRSPAMSTCPSLSRFPDSPYG